MKKIIIGLFVIMFTLYGCSKEDKIKDNIKSYLDKNASSPKSYEYVDLKFLDTITIGEISKRKLDEYETDIKEINEEIIRDQSIINKYPSLDNDSQEIQIKGNKEYLLKIAPKAESLKKHISNKDVVGYVALHSFRINNALGNIMLNNQYISFDKDFNVLNINLDIIETYSNYDEIYLVDLQK